MSVTKNKKTGKWEAWYYVRTSDGKLKRKAKKGLATRAEALKYETDHMHERDVGNQLTFENIFNELAKANRASELTTELRRQRLMDYAAELWAMPIKRISKERLIEWRDNLFTTELATATKNDIIGYVKQVFRYAYDVYDIYDAGKVLKTFPKTLEDIHEMRIINFQQFKNIMSYEPDNELRTFFQFLFMTGCRKGEARALLKTDFDGKSVKISKSMRRYESSLKTTKTRTQRVVQLDDDTCRKLELLCEKDGPYLFGDYAPLSLNKIELHFKSDLEKSGLPNMRIHDLRHSNVSMLWNAGVPVPEISKRIGHSSPKVTMETYAHIFDNTQKASLEYLNSLR